MSRGLPRALVALAALATLAPGPARGGPAPDDPLAAMLARTEAVTREVSKLRGLPVKRKIPYDVVDRDELRARLLLEANEPKAQREMAEQALVLGRWGEIPPDTDFPALVLTLLTEQIAGYYDPATKKLTVAKGAVDDPEWAEMVQAHEIDHGLQDQSFDLRAYEKVPDGEDDAELARRAVVEGDGIAVMIDVSLARQKLQIDWSAPEAVAMIQRDMGGPGAGSGSGGHDAFDRAPLVVRETMIFPYRAGFGFVAALRHRNPWSAVDAAFRKPPRSTSQILHPERYLAGEQPVAVQIQRPDALAGWTAAATTTWGELGFGLFLRAHGVDAAVATEAAAGWSGDRVAVWTRPADGQAATAVPATRAVSVARLEWETEADAIEAHEAATRALDDAVAGATIEHTDTRTRWLALDGTVAWCERRGPSLVLGIGAPASLAEALRAQAWTASGPGAPPASHGTAPERSPRPRRAR